MGFLRLLSLDLSGLRKSGRWYRRGMSQPKYSYSNLAGARLIHSSPRRTW